MRFQDFEKVMSRHRINRYLMACEGRSKKAMTLYRLNLRLSQEMFTIISCFEVALRNYMLLARPNCEKYCFCPTALWFYTSIFSMDDHRRSSLVVWLRPYQSGLYRHRQSLNGRDEAKHDLDYSKP
jgi:hypothetical protein